VEAERPGVRTRGHPQQRIEDAGEAAGEGDDGYLFMRRAATRRALVRSSSACLKAAALARNRLAGWLRRNGL
jgi:hypothetical protein